jgi:hypothetical protein
MAEQKIPAKDRHRKAEGYKFKESTHSDGNKVPVTLEQTREAGERDNASTV